MSDRSGCLLALAALALSAACVIALVWWLLNG